MIRAISTEELASWDKLVLQNPDGGHIYQSLEWGDYKAGYDWQPVRLVWENRKERLYVQALVKKAVGFGTIWYIPKGPGLSTGYLASKNTLQQIKQFTTDLRQYIVKNDPKAFMIMIEPEVYEGEIDLGEAGWRKSVHDLQFKATIIVDIDKDDEALLAGFKQKTRYNIRLAGKKGVTIEQRDATDDMVDTMYDLMCATQG
nr:peptidoglycan bridge formation glycyltransferase FemA/FemB family protein [Candidatus Saccharibacteria bacterium]